MNVLVATNSGRGLGYRRRFGTCKEARCNCQTYHQAKVIPTYVPLSFTYAQFSFLRIGYDPLALSTQTTADAQRSPSLWSPSEYGDDDVLQLASSSVSENEEPLSSQQGTTMQLDMEDEPIEPQQDGSHARDSEKAPHGSPTKSIDTDTAASSYPAPAPIPGKVLPSSSLPLPDSESSVALPEPSFRLTLPAPSFPAPPVPGPPHGQRRVPCKTARSTSHFIDPGYPPRGRGRILVPNSDTSGTTTFSQPSQSQSQSQSLLHGSQQSQGLQPDVQSSSFSPGPQKGAEHSQPQGAIVVQESVVKLQEITVEHSQETSHLRNEVLPSSDPLDPDDELLADSEPEEEGRLPVLVTQLPRRDQEELDQDDEIAKDVRWSSPARPSSPSSSTRHVAAVSSPEEPITRRRSPSQRMDSLEPEGAGALNGGVQSPSDRSQDADDEAEPDPFPSDATVSMDHRPMDSGSDSGEEFSESGRAESFESDEEVDESDSDDRRVEGNLLSTLVRKTRKTRSPLPSVPREESSQMVPDSQPSFLPPPPPTLPPPTPSPPSVPPTVLDEDAVHDQLDAEHSSDAPSMPANPDVFLSDAAFHREGSSSPSSQIFELHKLQTEPAVDEEPETVAVEERVGGADDADAVQAVAQLLPTVSNHDIETWRHPSFLRRSRKRLLSPSSSATEEEGLANKKRKVDSGSSAAEASSTKLKPYVLLPAPNPRRIRPSKSSTIYTPGLSTAASTRPATESATSKLKQINFRRSGSVSSTSSRTRQGAAQSLRREDSVKKVPTLKIGVTISTASSNTGLKEISFSRSSSSRSLKRVSQEPSRDGSAVAPSVSRRTSVDMDIDPHNDDVSRPLAASRLSSVARGKMPARDEPAVPSTPKTAGQPTFSGPSLLDYAESVFDKMQREGKVFVTWKDLPDMLLRIGRARHQEEELRKQEVAVKKEKPE